MAHARGEGGVSERELARQRQSTHTGMRVPKLSNMDLFVHRHLDRKVGT